MYCANMKNNRVIVHCNIVDKNRMRFLSAVYDTGAKYSCFSSNEISTDISEEDCKGFEKKYIRGFIGNEYSTFYKYHVNKLAIGTINLEAQNIWITFDKAVTTNIIGYDIIAQVSRLSFANSSKEYFFTGADELKDFLKKN